MAEDDDALEVGNVGDCPFADFEGGDRLIKVTLNQLKTYMQDPLILLETKIKRIEPAIVEGSECSILVSKCSTCHIKFHWDKIPTNIFWPPCPQEFCGGRPLRKPKFVLKFIFTHGKGESEALLLKDHANYFLGCTVYEFIKTKSLRDRIRRALNFLVQSNKVFKFCLRPVSLQQPYNYIVQSTRLAPGR